MEVFAVISYDADEQQTFVDYVTAEDESRAEERVADVRRDDSTVVCSLSIRYVESIRQTLLSPHEEIEADWQEAIAKIRGEMS